MYIINDEYGHFYEVKTFEEVKEIVKVHFKDYLKDMLLDSEKDFTLEFLQQFFKHCFYIYEVKCKLNGEEFLVDSKLDL